MFELTGWQYAGLVLLFFLIMPAWFYIISHVIGQGFYRGKQHVLNICIKEAIEDVKKQRS